MEITVADDFLGLCDQSFTLYICPILKS